MASRSWRTIFSRGPQRKTVRLQWPREQLTLPAYLLGITLLFGGLFAFQSHYAYSRMMSFVLGAVPPGLSGILLEQTHDFVRLSITFALAYLATVVVVCIAYIHRLVGPTVALARQVEALERGEYGTRVGLRSYDHVFSDVADGLNALSERLEREAKERDGAAPRVAAQSGH